jgi:hypothetical protein
MITYNQANGNLSKDGQLLGVGYSGHPPYVNDPTSEAIPQQGVIPRGLWTIGEVILEHPRLGPFVLPLTPEASTNVYQRSGFFCHGDEIATAGQELGSHGCIVMGRSVREAIVASGDTELEVV